MNTPQQSIINDGLHKPILALRHRKSTKTRVECGKETHLPSVIYARWPNRWCYICSIKFPNIAAHLLGTQPLCEHAVASQAETRSGHWLPLKEIQCHIGNSSGSLLRPPS